MAHQWHLYPVPGVGCPASDPVRQARVGRNWNKTSWHVSKHVRTWICQHNRAVKSGGLGVRILVCLLPIKSPWLNPIEPKWVHGKRAIVEPATLLFLEDIVWGVCAYFHQLLLPFLVVPRDLP